MMGRTTFYTGGIPDPVNSLDVPSQDVISVSLPFCATIPLLQHNGAEAHALVQVGQSVSEGECLARATFGLGAHVFSSIPGTVTDIIEHQRPDGETCKAVVVELGGSFPVSTALISDESWKLMEPRQILALVEERGLVTMGLHCHPLYRVLSPRDDSGTLRFVVNAVIPEPWQVSTAWFLRSKQAEILEGIQIIRRILGEMDITFAVSDVFEDVFKEFANSHGELSQFKHRILENRYPQGEDRYLFQSLFSQDIPAGETARDFNTLILDLETIVALRDAVVLGRPHLDRVVTVAGAGVAKPGLYRVRIGTPVATVLREAGGVSEEIKRVICGGAMHGCAISDLGLPVTRDMGMILALDQSEVQDAVKRDCMRCGNCIQTCPAGIEPIRLVRLFENGLLARAKDEGLMECSDCGICSHVCPSRLPLGTWLRQAKGQRVLPGALEQLCK